MADSNITKRALAQAMKGLMAKQPFSKISVGDICEACGMNRKSFYYHFRDKYDLVNWIFYSEFLASVQVAQCTNNEEFLESICRYFYSERSFYRNALRIEGQNSFQDYFREMVGPLLINFSKDLVPHHTNPEFAVNFIGDALLAALIRWLTEANPLPPDEYLAQVREMLDSFACIRTGRNNRTDRFQSIEKADYGRYSMVGFRFH